MGFKWSLFPSQKSHLFEFFNESYLKKCIPFTPKLIEIEIENRVFREINRDFVFRQNRTALVAVVVVVVVIYIYITTVVLYQPVELHRPLSCQTSACNN